MDYTFTKRVISIGHRAGVALHYTNRLARFPELRKAKIDSRALSAPRARGDLPVALPSELVRMRPDILAAEADLHAATADIGVATAALYPRITLGAAFSVASLQPDSLFNYESAGWSFGPSLTGSLFHGGSLRAQRRGAQRRGAQAAQVEAMARYEQTVLSAFVQVSDLLQAVTQDQALVRAQMRAADAAVENARLANLAYENGAGTLLSVIDAQRQSKRARLGLIQANAELRRDVVALFVATAADWRAAADR